MRNGFTTGTCAAAAAKAATYGLVHQQKLEEVAITLPGGDRVIIPLANVTINPELAGASVRKDAGDDPDITDKALIKVSVSFTPGSEVIVKGGAGVGVVTKPGLSVPVGKHAINPVPMQMIKTAIREVTDRGIQAVVEIPDGEKLAEKTFNPRLGVVGGLSILGTSGIVKPFSSDAIRETLRLSLEVAEASGVKRPILTPGRIGHRAIRKVFRITPEQVIEVGNEWGFILDHLPEHTFEEVLIVGHPGKLAKLIMGHWDTHSKRSPNAAPFVSELARSMFGESAKLAETVEGVIESLEPQQREKLAQSLASKINQAVSSRLKTRVPVSTVLINLKSEMIGHYGDLRPWAL